MALRKIQQEDRISECISEIIIDTNGFCIISYNKENHFEIGETEAHLICEAVCNICNDVPHLILHDSRDIHGIITKEGRTVLKEHERLKKVKIASAFVVNSFINRLLANLYISYTKPDTPTRVFDDIDSAISWLTDLR